MTEPPVWGIRRTGRVEAVVFGLLAIALTAFGTWWGALVPAIVIGLVAPVLVGLALVSPTRITFTAAALVVDRWPLGVRRRRSVPWQRIALLRLRRGDPDTWTLHLVSGTCELMLTGDTRQCPSPSRRRRTHARLLAAVHARGIHLLDDAGPRAPQPVDEHGYARFVLRTHR